jgi:hypothetical protein
MSLIKTLKEFAGIHTGKKIIVCGCGVSLVDFKEHHQDFITIGVNDVSELFDPTYLLVTDHSGRFSSDRRRRVHGTNAKYVFTCAKGWYHKNLVHFELGSRSLTNLDHPDRIDHYMNSPYAAAILAYKMGAKNIGLIGVDFTDGHFYNLKDGKHPIVKSNYLNKVNSAYQTLSSELAKRGTTLVNLSPISNLAIRKISLEEFKKI